MKRTNKICNNCGGNYECVNVDQLIRDSSHKDNCAFFEKIIYNRWWQFWVREKYNYIQ